MTTTAQAPLSGAPDQAPPRSRRGTRMLVLAGVMLVLLSVVRQVTGATEITSSGTIGAALVLAVPIGLAALGGLWAERAGVVNIGLEGMMILGTWFGAYGGITYGIWWALVLGAFGGALGGLVHAIATVSFGVDHIVSGVAVNIVAAGLARYLSVITYTGDSGGGATQSPNVTGSIPRVSLPLLSSGPDLLGDLESKHWLLVSDVAGLLRGLTQNISLFTLIAAALVVASWFLLWRTAFGLRLRACGESPSAAESLGVGVYRMKYIAVVISGAMAGLGGAFLVTVASSIYREGQTAGKGFIGLAALIFGNWRPGGLVAGSGLFGYAQGLGLRQGDSAHALVLLATLVTLLFAARALLARRWRAGAWMLAGAVVIGTYFALTDTVPDRLVSATPYIVTLVVLTVSAQKLRPPAADGLQWRRGQQR